MILEQLIVCMEKSKAWPLTQTQKFVKYIIDLKSKDKTIKLPNKSIGEYFPGIVVNKVFNQITKYTKPNKRDW